MLTRSLQRVMSYIESGKQQGATVHVGGEQLGTEGFFIQPTIFTECKPDMKIVKEEIFGPVAVFIKFKDEAGSWVDSHLRDRSRQMLTFFRQMSLSKQTIRLTDWLPPCSQKISAGQSVLLMRSRLELHG